MSVGAPTAKPIVYVCGFLHALVIDKPYVLLIRKNRPTWQAGRPNGVGGKIEPGETPIEAMRREFEEGSGLQVKPWRHFAVLSNPSYMVHYFECDTARDTLFHNTHSMTDEKICVVPVALMEHNPVMPNLLFLIPLALDRSEVIRPVCFFGKDAPA